MANQIITSATSINTGTGSAIANSDASNNLIIAPGAWVITSDSGAFTPAIDFTSVSGVSAVLNIDGYVAAASEPVIVISGQSLAYVTIGSTGVITGPGGGTGARALYLDVSSAAIVANAGSIYGDIQSLGAGSLNLDNEGLIFGRVIGSAAQDVIDNYGRITSDVDLGDGNNFLTNGPDARIYRYFGGAGGDFITNSGLIEQTVYLVDFGNMSTAANGLTNGVGGIILGSVFGDAGIENIDNYGYILQLNLDDGASGINNYAGASIAQGIFAGADNDSLLNDGRIGASVSLGGGSNSVTNTGIIVGGVSASAAGSLVVSNTGSIGGIFGGDVVDAYYGADGRLTGAALLGGGADFFLGGAGAEAVFGGLGVDEIDLGGGDDRFYATDGGDGDEEIYGGGGSDTYDASGTDAAISIFLEEGTATSADVGADVLFDFENAVGSSGDDFLWGDGAANTLSGGDGADRLWGESGNDVVRGNDGADRLWGGLGRDKLYGGLGDGDADRFILRTLSESTVALSGRDFIYQFVSGVDDIDVSALDARTDVVGNNAFSFIGTGAFTGVSGQLRYAVANGVANVSGDVNGDRVADFMISIANVSSLSAGDFFL